MIRVAPSLLSADFANLSAELTDIENCGAEVLHLDIMDGHYVPNLTFGVPVIKKLRTHSKLLFDVHLMVTNPADYVKELAESGVDYCTFHLEAEPHAHRLIQEIKKHGMKAGISLNPSTPVALLEDIISDLDLVLIMSVNPGFGGQSFIPQSINKIIKVKKMLQDVGNNNCEIEVDGGINKDTAKLVRDAGATLLVAGSAVFGAADRKEIIDIIRG